MKKSCNRMKVVAVGIDKHGSFTYAENGNYNEEGCTGVEGDCGCQHAEQELLKVNPNGLRFVFLSHSPCYNCAISLYEAGVEVVAYSNKYRISKGRDFLAEKGISLYYMGSNQYIS